MMIVSKYNACKCAKSASNAATWSIKAAQAKRDDPKTRFSACATHFHSLTRFYCTKDSLQSLSDGGQDTKREHRDTQCRRCMSSCADAWCLARGDASDHLGSGHYHFRSFCRIAAELLLYKLSTTNYECNHPTTWFSLDLLREMRKWLERSSRLVPQTEIVCNGRKCS